MKTLPQQNKWPCYFSPSNTTGEKDFEEFYTNDEVLDMHRFENLGVIKNKFIDTLPETEQFSTTIDRLKNQGHWDKKEIVDLFHKVLPGFDHKEVGKYLDSKM